MARGVVARSHSTEKKNEKDIDGAGIAANLRLVNTSTTQTNAAPATSGAMSVETYNRARANCSCRHHAFPCEKCEALKGAANASRHTQEPWHHSADLPQHGCRLIHAPDGYLVADAGRITRRTGAEMDSNARRIVQCVNACAGMTDPAKEIASLRAALAGKGDK